MKPSHSRRFRIGLAAVLTVVLVSAGASRDQATLVAVYIANIGMASPQGNRSYVTVDKYGAMTFANPTEKEWLNGKRTLRRSELRRLQEVLSNVELSRLRGNILADFHPPVYDYQTSLRVTITRESGAQEFTLVNYDPSAGRDFPPGAKELLCLVDELRRSSFACS
jgi:hypothetical protein